MKICFFSLALSGMLMALFGTAQSSDNMTSPSGIVWPTTQALPTFAEAKNLDVADIESLPGDEQLTLVTLQGLVNRSVPRIYLLQSNDDEGKYTWLKEGIDLPYQEHEDPWSLLDKYRALVKGLIVYDPNVPDSINVATTLAGLKNGVVVSPSLAERLTDPFNLPVLADLRGRFSSRVDAYTWQVDHLWEQTTHRMLVGLAPTRSVSIPPGIPASFTTLERERRQVRDSSNRDVYTLELSPYAHHSAVYVRFDDSFPEDGWGPAVHEVTVRADGKIIARFVPGSTKEATFLYDSGGSQVNEGEDPHRFADNGNYLVYQFRVPKGVKRLTLSAEMWNQFKVSASAQQPPTSDLQEPFGMLRDYAVANRAMVFWLDPNVPEERTLLARIMDDVAPYTPYLGWFAQDVAGEFSGTELTSEHGVYVLASDWFANLTAFSGTRSSNPAPLPPQASSVKLTNKIYLTFVMSEGDNLQYNEHRMRQLWDDPARGEVPVNWSVSPLLLDAAPAIMDYYQRTATENDLLIAGPSGAGYIYPTPWPDPTFSSFANQTRTYLRRSGLDVVYTLNRVDGVNVPLSATKARAYEEAVSPQGLFLSWESYSDLTFLEQGTPQATVHGVGSVSEAKEALTEVAATWQGKAPRFVSLGVLAWSMTPHDLQELVSDLPTEFEVVRADTFFELARESRQ